MTQTLIFITTFIIQFIIAIEMNMIGSIAPFLSQYFHIKPNMVILFNLGFSAVGIFVPQLGILADRHGKKKIIKFALLFFIFGSILASFSTSAILFAISRIFIGLGYYTLSGTNLSYVSEFINYENRGKASGLLRTAFGIATIFTPLYATSLITKFNNLSSVYLPFVLLGIIAFILLLKLPETEVNEDSKLDIDGFIRLLKDSRSKKVFASIFFITTAPTLTLSFMGIFLAEKFNQTQVQIGIAYTITAIGTISGILLASLLADRVGKLRISKIFFILMVIAQIPLPYLDSPIFLAVFAAIFAVGLDGGWTAYQTFATEVSPQNRGTFMNLFYTTNALTVTLFSFVGSIIYSIGGYYLAVGIGAISSAIGLYLVSTLKETGEV